MITDEIINNAIKEGIEIARKKETELARAIDEKLEVRAKAEVESQLIANDYAQANFITQVVKARASLPSNHESTSMEIIWEDGNFDGFKAAHYVKALKAVPKVISARCELRLHEEENVMFMFFVNLRID